MLLPLTQVQSLAPNGVYGRRPGDNAAVDSLPDLLLIERSRGGEQRAIEALVRRYSRRLFRVARSVLVEEDAAESAVQDAYLAAFADLSRYTPTGKFAAWLTRLTFTQARAPAAGTRPGQPATPRQLAAEEPGADEAREALERHELEKAIMALPEVFRTVLVLRSVEGISGIETAASLGVHETTVRTRMYRAQRRLGAELVQRLRLAQGLFELERHEHTEAHPLRGGGRLDQAGAGTPCAEVAQVALDARAGRLVAAVARGLSFGLELAHARLDGLQAPRGDEVRMRADGSLG